jgi:hypothetical protein
VLDDYLRCQDGVLTLAHARSAGLSHEAIRRRLRSGRWRRCARGVYFVDDRPFTHAARIRAAVRGYGQLAAASGLAAAWWHGLTRFPPDIVEVTVPRNSHGRGRDGCRVRRRDLYPSDIVVHRRIRATALPLTALDQRPNASSSSSCVGHVSRAGERIIPSAHTKSTSHFRIRRLRSRSMAGPFRATKRRFNEIGSDRTTSL